jgi:ATP-dependent Zn protease
MVYGMTPEIGLVSYQGGEDQQVKPYSEETHELIDESIKRIVDECYERTREILLSKRELIEK